METEVINPTRDPDWDRDVNSHPDSSFFHTAAWAKVLCMTYGHEPFYLRCSQAGNPVALVPIMEVRSPLTGRRGVCLPFTDFCGPLLVEGQEWEPVIDKLFEIARKQKWKHLEIRGKLPRASGRASMAFLGHSLDLRAGPEKLPAGFDDSVRRAIRKAERSGLTVETSGSREAILDFYRLHGQTRKRHGVPPQPLSFFLNIHREIIEPGLGFVVLARRASRPVAASVFFRCGKKAIYKFGASEETQQEFRGNNLVMWKGIEFLAREGVEQLHFGRTSLGNEGLRRFKLAWGTREETLEYFKFDTAANAWVTARDRAAGFHNRLFGSLPLALNRVIGSMIYPHLD